MASTFQPGDQVAWQAGQGTTTGIVQERVTESVKVNGHAVAATNDDPRYLVKNDRTGTITGHRPETLSLVEGQSSSEASDPSTAASEPRTPMRDKITEFESVVNMTANEIAQWLATEESKSVGQKDESGQIKGRQSGQHIIRILHKHPSDYTEADQQRIQKVVSYIHRHTAQRPAGDIENTRWRYSLMNWGHDPLKNSR
jgi:hypothetical protein